jgi:uncharacterized membrane protein SirB2
MFAAFKVTHLATVTLTLALFVLRAIWAFTGSPLLRHPVMRWLPHVNDTILLASALGAAALLGQYPFVNSWLTAKLVALIAYILLGHMALWRAPTTVARAAWTSAALMSFAYIVAVAWCHDPKVLVCFAP